MKKVLLNRFRAQGPRTLSGSVTPAPSTGEKSPSENSGNEMESEDGPCTSKSSATENDEVQEGIPAAREFLESPNYRFVDELSALQAEIMSFSKHDEALSVSDLDVKEEVSLQSFTHPSSYKNPQDETEAMPDNLSQLNPAVTRASQQYVKQVKPVLTEADLLAILTGKLGPDEPFTPQPVPPVALYPPGPSDMQDVSDSSFGIKIVGVKSSKGGSSCQGAESEAILQMKELEVNSMPIIMHDEPTQDKCILKKVALPNSTEPVKTGAVTDSVIKPVPMMHLLGVKASVHNSREIFKHPKPYGYHQSYIPPLVLRTPSKAFPLRQTNPFIKPSYFISGAPELPPIHLPPHMNETEGGEIIGYVSEDMIETEIIMEHSDNSDNSSARYLGDDFEQAQVQQSGMRPQNLDVLTKETCEERTSEVEEAMPLVRNLQSKDHSTFPHCMSSPPRQVGNSIVTSSSWAKPPEENTVMPLTFSTTKTEPKQALPKTKTVKITSSGTEIGPKPAPLERDVLALKHSSPIAEPNPAQQKTNAVTSLLPTTKRGSKPAPAKTNSSRSSSYKEPKSAPEKQCAVKSPSTDKQPTPSPRETNMDTLKSLAAETQPEPASRKATLVRSSSTTTEPKYAPPKKKWVRSSSTNMQLDSAPTKTNTATLTSLASETQPKHSPPKHLLRSSSTDTVPKSATRKRKSVRPSSINIEPHSAPPKMNAIESSSTDVQPKSAPLKTKTVTGAQPKHAPQKSLTRIPSSNAKPKSKTQKTSLVRSLSTNIESKAVPQKSILVRSSSTSIESNSASKKTNLVRPPSAYIESKTALSKANTVSLPSSCVQPKPASPKTKKVMPKPSASKASMVSLPSSCVQPKPASPKTKKVMPTPSASKPKPVPPNLLKMTSFSANIEQKPTTNKASVMGKVDSPILQVQSVDELNSDQRVALTQNTSQETSADSPLTLMDETSSSPAPSQPDPPLRKGELIKMSIRELIRKAELGQLDCETVRKLEELAKKKEVVAMLEKCKKLENHSNTHADAEAQRGVPEQTLVKGGKANTSRSSSAVRNTGPPTIHATKSAIEPTAEPVTKPAEPDTKPAAEPASKPAAEPAIKPAVKSTTKPMTTATTSKSCTKKINVMTRVPVKLIMERKVRNIQQYGRSSTEDDDSWLPPVKQEHVNVENEARQIRDTVIVMARSVPSSTEQVVMRANLASSSTEHSLASSSTSVQRFGPPLGDSSRHRGTKRRHSSSEDEKVEN